MISQDKSTSTYDVFCDFCTRVKTFRARTWKALLKQLRDAGWEYRNENNEWVHYCPDCVEEKRS